MKENIEMTEAEWVMMMLEISGWILLGFTLAIGYALYKMFLSK